ncbi:unannotated protein [freshwater metagenome]|uniref:Unannotated protein n=1 Tax=freshwater metagenome TaxID=449393 RepID=A0A6J6YDR2_9ZZZZ
MICTAVAHHIATNRSVTDLRGEVDGVRCAVDAVEVLGERLPLPSDSLVKRGAGDVFDTFHDFDKPVMTIRCDRSESHTAISHDGGGDALPRRWREVGIPTHLAVIVRVDVDPSRSHEETGGI